MRLNLAEHLLSRTEIGLHDPDAANSFCNKGCRFVSSVLLLVLRADCSCTKQLKTPLA